MKVDALLVGLGSRCVPLYLLRTQTIENGTLLLRTHYLSVYPILSYLILSYHIPSHPIHHRDTSRNTFIRLALLISICAFSAFSA